MLFTVYDDRNRLLGAEYKKKKLEKYEELRNNLAG